jgi:hypothetical protein
MNHEVEDVGRVPGTRAHVLSAGAGRAMQLLMYNFGQGARSIVLNGPPWEPFSDCASGLRQ